MIIILNITKRLESVRGEGTACLLFPKLLLVYCFVIKIFEHKTKYSKSI